MLSMVIYKIDRIFNQVLKRTQTPTETLAIMHTEHIILPICDAL